MSQYRKNQLDNVKGDYLKVKVVSDNGETLWLSINRDELELIKKVLV